MKKNLLYLLIGISAFFASCQDPEGVGVDNNQPYGNLYFRAVQRVGSSQS